jgi:hypothetical protein
MDPISRRVFLHGAALAAGSSLFLPQGLWAKLPPGVETKVDPDITGEERTLQPGIWALEVNFKPLRLIRVEYPDPRTGETRLHLVWYLCYRAVNRPFAPREAVAQTIQEVGDPEKPLALFVPEFTLVTEDNNDQKIYVDRVMPAAQAAIEKREKHKYKNSVEIVGPIPPITPVGSKTEEALYGVATWRSVDPATDRFKIFMTGFSNGYRLLPDAPDGKKVIQRRTLVQEFWRPGDEFDPLETEIRPVGPPQWIYR